MSKLQLHGEAIQPIPCTKLDLPPAYEAQAQQYTRPTTIHVQIPASTIERIANDLIDLSARLTLRGIVTAQVGKHADNHVFLNQSIETSWSNVLAASNRSRTDSKTYNASLSFPITEQAHGIPSSACLRGSTYVTEHTALRDQHLVQGQCDVLYWITATTIDNRPSPPAKPEHVLSCIGVVVTPPSQIALQPISTIATTSQSINLRRMLGVSYRQSSPPKIMMRISEARIQLSISRKDISATHSIRLPIEMRIAMARSSQAALIQDALRREVKDFLSGKAQLLLNQRFGSRTEKQDHVIHQTKVQHSTKLQHIDVPPFYVSRDGDMDVFTSVAELMLDVPSIHLQVSSCDLSLLQLSYVLNLELTTRKLVGHDCTLLSSHSCKLRIPCGIS